MTSLNRHGRVVDNAVAEWLVCFKTDGIFVLEGRRLGVM
jgi:hypothetical protein